MTQYRWEMVSCGSTCCRHAKTHGPYLYSYEGGRRDRRHLYGGRGGLADDGVSPAGEDTPVREYAPSDAIPHGATVEIPPMDDATAMAMRRAAAEKAAGSKKAFRRSLSREERRRFDELERREVERASELRGLGRKERDVYRESGHSIPKGTRGGALAAIKAEIAAQLDAEKKELLKQLQAERKAVSESLKANRAEMREMVSSKTPRKPSKGSPNPRPKK